MASDYDVGYRKPPKHTQFKKGQSGNPKGKPKGTKALKTDLQEELGEKLVIPGAGKTKKVSKQRAFVMRLTANAINGDPRAMTLLANLVLRSFADDPEPVDDVDFTEADEMILEEFRKSLLADAPEGESKGEDNAQ